MTTAPNDGGVLVRYDAACRALAEAKSVDEAKQILDASVALRAYAKQAKNRDLEADAVEIRMRATRRLDQLRQAQKECVGLNRGAAAGGEKDGPRGLLINPRDLRPTLSSQGIDKTLAHQGRVLGRLSDQQFEQTIVKTRDAVNRALRTVVQVAEIDQERERAKTRIETATAAGCTIDDLGELAASGYRAGAILVDPPWPFATWSHTGLAGDNGQENRRPRSRAAPYQTMSHEDIYRLPIAGLAADDCVLFLWVVQTQLDKAFEAVRRWGFALKSVGFAWFKGDQPDDDAGDLHVPMGTGFWTRAGFEQCWLATRGNPRRLHADVRQVIVKPRREHSRKPDCVHEHVERLIRGPYLELFARPTSPGLSRPGWMCWGNEIARDALTAKVAAPPQPPTRPQLQPRPPSAKLVKIIADRAQARANARAAAAPAQPSAPPPRVLNRWSAGEKTMADRVRVNVMRPGKWGNQYKLRPNATLDERTDAIARYRAWIVTQPALMAALAELRGKDLVCCCAPLPCHADVLLELANREAPQPSAPADDAAPADDPWEIPPHCRRAGAKAVRP